jgi:2,3-bisphosphoglycerate-independent phosphoglycerate mutase
MKTALVVLDGLGLSADPVTNPVFSSRTPFLDSLLATTPHTVIEASAEFVGLPYGEVGNSEVGHYNLGTGDISWQTQELINQSISDKSFFSNVALKKTIDAVKKKGSKLHLIGLISNGGIHSKMEHLFSLLEFAKNEGLTSDQVFIHGFTDGRDTPPKIAYRFFHELEQKIKLIGLGVIASVSGRYYAMDRDDHWDRTMLAYNVMTRGQGKKARNAEEAIRMGYERKESDEFIKPTVIINDLKQPKVLVAAGDGVIIFNYRADRARQIVKAFLSVDPTLPKRQIISPLFFTTMTPYETDWKLQINVAFMPIPPKITLASLISDQELMQLHLAETEKYAHVTYFFNGGDEKPHHLEKFIVVPSPRVSTYDKKPEMSAPQIVSNLQKELTYNIPDFVLVNFANCDMVGHTGNFKAIVKAIEAVDQNLKNLMLFLAQKQYTIFVTADHGNAEEAINPTTGEIDKEHSINPVFLLKVDPQILNQINKYVNHQTVWTRLALELKKGVLADVTATVAYYLGIKSTNFSGTKIL